MPKTTCPACASLDAITFELSGDEFSACVQCSKVFYHRDRNTWLMLYASVWDDEAALKAVEEATKPYG